MKQTGALLWLRMRNWKCKDVDSYDRTDALWVVYYTRGPSWYASKDIQEPKRTHKDGEYNFECSKTKWLLYYLCVAYSCQHFLGFPSMLTLPPMSELGPRGVFGVHLDGRQPVFPSQVGAPSPNLLVIFESAGSTMGYNPSPIQRWDYQPTFDFQASQVMWWMRDTQFVIISHLLFRESGRVHVHFDGRQLLRSALSLFLPFLPFICQERDCCGIFKERIIFPITLRNN